MDTDVELGKAVHEFLVKLGVETPMSRAASWTRVDNEVNFKSILACQEDIMQCLGLDLKDDSLAETPKRVAKMYTEELFYGLDYGNFPKCTTVENKMQSEEMVSVNGIAVMSCCEHHFLPFVGKASVAYLPDTRILGLSKFNRVVDFFSRRPQIQERLTEQIAGALRHILGTDNVAVVIRADHFCVKLRGVQDHCSSTVTSRVSGKFRAVPELRAEFLSLAGI